MANMLMLFLPTTFLQFVKAQKMLKQKKQFQFTNKYKRHLQYIKSLCLLLERFISFFAAKALTIVSLFIIQRKTKLSVNFLFLDKQKRMDCRWPTMSQVTILIAWQFSLLPSAAKFDKKLNN